MGLLEQEGAGDLTNRLETSTKFAAKMQQKGEEHGEKIIVLLPFVSRNIWRFFFAFFEDNATMSSIWYSENHAL